MKYRMILVAPVMFLLVGICYSWQDELLLNVAVDRRPVIGIVAETTDPGTKPYGDSYIYGTYVKFIEQAGALVVPIRINEPSEYYTDLFWKLNGVVFPGGGVSLSTSPYARVAEIFFNMSIKANDAGDFFPILGICLGFEELTVLRTITNQLVSCKGEDMSLPLTFTQDARKSRLLHNIPDDLYDALGKWNLTYNNHQYCITQKIFAEFAQLSQFYRIISTSFDEDGTEFISTMEAYKYPFYGTQWHPEKNSYLWGHYRVNHSSTAVRASQYIANFFVDEARKSRHDFGEDLVDSVIYNYQPRFMGEKTMHNIYFFKNSCVKWWQFTENEFDLLNMMLTGTMIVSMVMIVWVSVATLNRRRVSKDTFDNYPSSDLAYMKSQLIT